MDEIQHQPTAVATLQRALRNDRVAHAFLFEGPDGVGKETTASALTSCLLCRSTDKNGEACGVCDSCRMFAGGSHPDFQRVHRGLHRQHPDLRVRRTTGLFLTIDIVRHFLVAPAAVTPRLGGGRVFIVAEAERMTDDAQNALLKTLEEPPGRTVIMLLTSAASRLLSTIRSRCRRVQFNALPREFVEHVLTHRVAVPPHHATMLANLCGGRVGLALRWRQLGLLDELPPIAALIEQAHHGHFDGFADALIERIKLLAKRITAAERGDAASETDADESEDSAIDGDNETEEESAAKGAKLGTDVLRDAAKLLLMLMAALVRDGLLLAEGADPKFLLLGKSRLAEMLARSGDAAGLSAAITAVARCEQMLDANVNQKMAFDRLCLGLNRVSAIAN
ncbi:MAG: DNA polymerase III subunit [Phycisphaerales bacterium]|nr:DNA polymerase III subunit [Phycisphaerales bacterium]